MNTQMYSQEYDHFTRIYEKNFNYSPCKRIGVGVVWRFRRHTTLT
jgi:hypothetical protein